MKIALNTSYQQTPITTSNGLHETQVANKVATTQATTRTPPPQFAGATAPAPAPNVAVHAAQFNFAGGGGAGGGGGHAAAVKG